jgi:nitrate/nitrite transporter NarK
MNFFATGMAWTYVVVLVSPILGDLGLGLRDWGTIWSGISMGALLGALPAGALGDRFGVRRSVAVGALAMGAALALRGVAGGLAPMLVSMVLFGLTLALVATNLPKALGTWFPPHELGLANGVALAGNGAGQGLATFAAPLLLAPLGGWRPLTFGIAAVVTLLGVAWAMSVRDRAPAGGASVERPSAATGARAGLAAVLRVRDVWILAACYLLFLGGYIGVVGYLPTYLATVQGLAPARAGLMLTVLLGAYVAGSLTLPAFSDRLGLRRRVYAPGMLVCAAMLLASAFASGASLVGVMAVWGLAAGVVAILFAVPLELPAVGPALAGSAVGAALMAGFVGGFLSPMIGLALAERRPLFGFLFWGGCYALSGLLFLTLPETGARARRATAGG